MTSALAYVFSSNAKRERSLFITAAVAHLAVFFTLLSLYGPYSFFLSTDGSLNGNDTQNYVTIAKNLTEGNGYSRFPDIPFEPDGFRTPLIVFYFLPFIAVGGLHVVWLAMLVLQIVLSFAPVLLYRLARLFLDWRYSFAAGLALALEPLYLYRSQIAEPDAVFVLIILTVLYFLTRHWHMSRSKGFSPKALSEAAATPFKELRTDEFAEGENISAATSRSYYWYFACAFLGIAILAKPTALYLAAITFVFHALFLMFFGKGTTRSRLINWIIGLCIACAIVAPWLVRNAITFDTWSLSSVTGYNLYAYYTNAIPLPGEAIPAAISSASRDPARDLRFQNYFTHIAVERIRHQPAAYARDHFVGIVRNLFVSDISAIYYYDHAAILPFAYNPESDPSQSLFANVSLSRLLWILLLATIYMTAFAGWALSWKKDRLTFLVFTLFLALFAYLIVASGPFVDAKYRLPGVPLVIIVSLYGIAHIRAFFRRIAYAGLAK